MTDPTPTMSATKQALQAIQALQRRVHDLEHATAEPVAVVGMACHFPGDIHSPEAYWKALLDGKDLISEVPAERWDVDQYYDSRQDVPGKMYTRHGGFLHNIDQFDAAFFGISPREANAMDPQQRLLLQTVWEAFDSGGFDVNELHGSKVGVYVGISNFEYGAHLIWPDDKSKITAYSGTGGSLGVAAGRLSYTFGFTGPSMIIDTACSSSLVTTHLAIQALRLGECDMAVSAGVNLILGPETHINFCQAHMLAPDGRCKTFSDDADGYARGEGVGSILLKRLSDAERDGDRIYAVLLGSAVNQDGPSGGLTVPNGPSQERVIQAALRNARIQPSDVGYIEAHGTGTSLGDPIEIGALSRVFGAGRDKWDHPLVAGSVKTNIGHLESAAGVAGLIKTILSTSKGVIPPHRNVSKLNTHIDWASFPGKVPLEPHPWTTDRRIAGVSSFSFSGTNAHVVVSNYLPASIQSPSEDATPKSTTSSSEGQVLPQGRILPITGKSPAHLEASRLALLEALREDSSHTWQEWCTSAALGRTHHHYRATIIADSMADALEELGKGPLKSTPKKSNPPRVAFLFTGQGAQYAGMGRELYDDVQGFRNDIDACNSICEPILGYSLISLMYPTDGDLDSDLIHATKYTQPALFAFEYALARYLMSLGIEPDLMLGHSLGEYVAATLSGVFRLEDALKIVCERGRLMETMCETGAMLSVSTTVPTITAYLAEPAFNGKVCLASVNTPDQVVVAGDHESVAAFQVLMESKGLDCTMLRVSHAFHSHLVEPMLDDFRAAFSSISLQRPTIPVISNLDGKLAEAGQITSADYWCQHVRRPVQFALSVETLLREQVDIVIEVGPKPILTAFGKQIAESSTHANLPHWVATQRKQVSSWHQMLSIIANLFEMGLDEPLRQLNIASNRYPVDLPTTAFLTDRYWFSDRTKPEATYTRLGHLLLGERIDSPILPAGSHLFLQTFSPSSLGFLSHHRVGGNVVLPAAAHTEMLYQAASESLGHNAVLSDVYIQKALILSDVSSTTVQTIVKRVDINTLELEIHSRSEEQGSWQLHTVATAGVDTTKSREHLDLNLLKRSHSEQHDVQRYYEASHALGIAHGEQFQAIKSIRTNDSSILGELDLPTELAYAHESLFMLHPVLLDAAYQLASYALRDTQSPYLPIGAGKVKVYGPLNRTVIGLCESSPSNLDSKGGIYTCDVTLLDQEGAVLAQIYQLKFQKTSLATLSTGADSSTDWFYELEWVGKPLDVPSAPQLLNPIETGGQTEQALAHLADTCPFYEALFNDFDGVIEQAIIRSLNELGWTPELGSKAEFGTLAKELGIHPNFIPLFRRCIEILSESGRLTFNGISLEVKSSITASDLPSAADLIAKHPQAAPEISLLLRCLEGLSGVLKGDTDPLGLLFPAGDQTDAVNLYQHSIGSRAINEVLASAVSDAIAGLASNQKLRILEIGAGTGGTTARVLPALPPDRTEYWFTDISAHFTRMGSQQFSQQYPFMRFGILDIEQNKADFDGENFDLIIAANVLHATRNIQETLDHCRQRLAPGGMLLLLEASPKQRWLDLTFGMTDGWWRFEGIDINRDSYPLLSSTEWKSLLKSTSYESGSILGEDMDAVKNALRQQVVVARKPLDSPIDSGHLVFVSDGENTLGQQLIETMGSRVEQLPIESVCSWLKDLDSDQREAVHLVLGYPDNLSSADLDHRAQHAVLGPLITLAQSLANHEGSTVPKLWVVARGALQGYKEQSPSPYGSLPGLIRTIRSEYPEFRATLIDPGDLNPESIAQMLSEEIDGNTDEDLIAYVDGVRSVQRLKPYGGSAMESVTLHIDTDATYVITGGFGRMGILTAYHLAQLGAKHLLLLGRNIPDQPDLERLLEPFADLGTKVYPVAGDIADPVVVAALFNEVNYPSIRGIIHAAGTLADTTIAHLEMHHLDDVMRTKVTGTWLLHKATMELQLDFFIVYSSIGALFGPVGQSNYAAANAWMDQLMLHRVECGLPGLTINWGAWSGEGLAVRDAVHTTTTMMSSIRAIDPDRGIRAFGQLFGKQGQVVAVPIDWSKAAEQLATQPLLEAFMTNSVSSSPQRHDTADLLGSLQGLSESDRIDALIQIVMGYTANVLGSSPDRIDPTQGFFDMGMDSLTSVELRNALQSATKLNLPTTLIFKYPTIEALAEFLSGELHGQPAEIVHDDGPTSGKPEHQPSTTSTKTADVGSMSDDELSALIDDAFKDLEGGNA